MSWFKKKTGERYRFYKVTITYEALVMAKNDTHAVNLVREFRNDVYDMTRKFIGKFSIDEANVKAKKL